MIVTLGPDLVRYLMPKGSVAVDGVSLTVDAGPFSDHFTVYLIPHTLAGTFFGRARVGQFVNLEMDVLVKAARSGKEILGTELRGLSDGKRVPGGDDASVRPADYGLTLEDVLARGWRRR
jgi:riboflavin synthase alpha subunit